MTMIRPILETDAPVTLVGGGQANTTLLAKALSFGPILVCADGGARLAAQAGLLPAAVIGDFDSLGDLELPKERLHYLPDQNSTDFEKCLTHIAAPLFIGVGFLGGRLDHQLAAMTVLLGEERPVILVSERECAFVAPAQMQLELPPSSPIGFYPLRQARLTTRGVRYPLKNAKVAPDGLISTSNHVEAGQVEVFTDRHAVLVTLPLGALEAVLVALSAPGK